MLQVRNKAAMSGYRRRAGVCAAYLGTFLATLDISIVNVALPTIQTELSTDIAGLQWVVNAYAICLAALTLSAGPMADRHGHRRVWLCGVALFTLGSAVCGAASSLSLLLIGRVMQGIAAAFVISGALPILTHLYPDPAARSQVVGGWSAFTALALMLGPLLGGQLLHAFGWQSIFLINLPLGVLALGFGLWGIPERRHPQHAARDPVGLVLSVVVLAGLTFGLIEAGEYGWTGAVPLVSLACAVIALAGFLANERRVRRPLLPLGLLQDRRFAVANLASMLLGFSYYSTLFLFAIFLQQVQGWSPAEAGLRMVPQFVATLCVSTLFGRLNRSLPLQCLMVAGYALLALGLLLLTQVSEHTPYWVVGSCFALLGCGAGLAVPATSIVIMGMAPAEQAGAASATMNTLRQTGMTVGIALLGTLMTERAVSLFAQAADALGQTGAGEMARDAVARQVVPDAPVALESVLRSAMAGGFQLAMAVAGLACVTAMVLVIWSPARAAVDPAEVLS